MRKHAGTRIAVPLAVIVVASVIPGATAGPARNSATLRGWVSDEYCGAQHTKPGGADCVRKCIKGGADIGHPEWKPQRTVFVADDEKRVWIVQIRKRSRAMKPGT